MCGQDCEAQPVCSSRRRRAVPEIGSERETLEIGLFEDSKTLGLSGKSKFRQLVVPLPGP